MRKFFTNMKKVSSTRVYSSNGGLRESYAIKFFFSVKRQQTKIKNSIKKGTS